MILHQLGAVSFLSAAYQGTFAGSQGYDPQLDWKPAPLRATDGARRAYSRIGQVVRSIPVVCCGTSVLPGPARTGGNMASARAAADAIDAQLILARSWPLSGVPILYVVEFDSDTSPDNWYCLGGVLKRLDDMTPSGWLKCQLTMYLSKN